MAFEDIPWKRMRFRGERVWVAVNEDGSLRIHDGKAAIKYRLENDAQYWVRADAVHPIAPDRSPDAAAQLPIDFIGSAYEGCGPGTVCIFAEGVALGNPGPAGIGIVLRYEGLEKTLSASIGAATEAAAAIEAVGRGLAEIRLHEHPVRIFCSSGYAYGVLALGWKALRHAGRVGAVRRLMARFSDIQLVWPTDHPRPGPARQAQDLARRAAESTGSRFPGEDGGSPAGSSAP
jgi:ribonuclease HI